MDRFGNFESSWLALFRNIEIPAEYSFHMPRHTWGRGGGKGGGSSHNKKAVFM